MQVPSIPPPLVAYSLPQEIASKAVPHAQAVAPLSQNAVAPTPKAEKFNTVRRNKNDSRNRNQNRDHQPEDKDESGDHSINIRI
jgi:hypothetical protein